PPRSRWSSPGTATGRWRASSRWSPRSAPASCTPWPGAPGRTRWSCRAWWAPRSPPRRLPPAPRAGRPAPRRLALPGRPLAPRGPHRGAPLPRARPAAARGGRHHHLRGLLRGRAPRLHARAPAPEPRPPLLGGRLAPLLPPGGDLDLRHRGDVRRAGDRGPEARAGGEPGEDPGGERGRRPGRARGGAAVPLVDLPRRRGAGVARRAGGHRPRRLGGGAGRRPGRIALQAAGRSEGLEPADPGTRRGARPARLALLRGAGLGRPLPGPGSRLMRGVAILGSTGSIGRSTLAVLRRQREHFRVVALTGGCNRAALEAQAAEWRPRFVGIAEPQEDAAIPSGAGVLIEAALHPEVDVVVNAVVGAAGLDATLAALRAGKRVALANKEALVMAGDLVREAARSG